MSRGDSTPRRRGLLWGDGSSDLLYPLLFHKPWSYPSTPITPQALFPFHIEKVKCKDRIWLSVPLQMYQLKVGSS